MAIPRDSQLTCTFCTSTFFYVARAEQFASGGYGSAEFRSTSNAPKTILVCAGCGMSVTPKASQFARGTIAAVAEDDFRKSIEAGQKFRQANSIQNIVNIAASPSEVQDLRDEITELRKALNPTPTQPVITPTEVVVREKKATKKVEHART